MLCNELCLRVLLGSLCVADAQDGPTRALGLLGQDCKMLVRHHMDAGNGT